MSNIIYGKSKNNLPWPLFLDFIQKEEEHFRKISNILLNEFPKKKLNQNLKKLINHYIKK